MPARKPPAQTAIPLLDLETEFAEQDKTWRRFDEAMGRVKDCNHRLDQLAGRTP